MPVSTQGAGSGRRAVRLHVELHEHVVPDLDVAVAVLLGAARGPPAMSGPWSKISEQGPQGPVSAIIQKLSLAYAPLLSPMRTTRSGGRPISLVQMS